MEERMAITNQQVIREQLATIKEHLVIWDQLIFREQLVTRLQLAI
jgi:hypothetical protein